MATSTGITRLSYMLPSMPFVLASLIGHKSIPKYALLTSQLNVDMGGLGILYPTSHRAAPDFVLTMATAMCYAGQGFRFNKDLEPFLLLHQQFQTLSSLKQQTKTPSTSNASNFSCRVLRRSPAQSNARRPNASTISLTQISSNSACSNIRKNTAASPSTGHASITRFKQITPSMSTT